MSSTILTAVALQHRKQHRARALAARDVVSALASGGSAHLHILSVYNYKTIDTNGPPSEVAARYRDEQMQRIDADQKRKMDAYTASLEAARIRVSKLLLVGHPRDIIGRVARDIKANLLVIGTPSRRGMFDPTLGGTARQTSRRALARCCSC